MDKTLKITSLLPKILKMVTSLRSKFPIDQKEERGQKKTLRHLCFNTII